MDFAITFLEGVISFVSPCLLPMLPIYAAYFAGDAGAGMGDANSGGAGTGAAHAGHAAGEGAADAGMPRAGAGDGGEGAATGMAPAGRSRTLRTMRCAVGFIVGFSALFVAMGAFAGTVGSFFLRHQAPVNAVCGIIVIALGLNYLGVLRIPALARTLKPKTGILPRSFASSLAFGVVFAIGWTPCVGAFLGSALSLAASSGQTATGILLLLAYSLGLGIPFFIAAVLIDQLEGAFSWVKRHYGVIDKGCGAVLVLVGVLMATGTLGLWMRALSV